MERKRDGLLPIGEFFGGMKWPVQAVPNASPRRGTTSPGTVKLTGFLGGSTD